MLVSKNEKTYIVATRVGYSDPDTFPMYSAENLEFRQASARKLIRMKLFSRYFGTNKSGSFRTVIPDLVQCGFHSDDGSRRNGLSESHEPGNPEHAESTQNTALQETLNIENYLSTIRNTANALYYDVIKKNDLSERASVPNMQLLYAGNSNQIISIALFSDDGTLPAQLRMQF